MLDALTRWETLLLEKVERQRWAGAGDRQADADSRGAQGLGR
jgi:hypothetical protein